MSEFLKGYEVYNLDIGAMLLWTKYRGDFEERFKWFQWFKEKGKTVCFIDEAHNISGAGAGGGQNSNDSANLLKPVLTKGDLKVVASQLGKNTESILRKTEHWCVGLLELV